MSDVLAYLGVMIIGVVMGFGISINGTRDHIVSDCKNFEAFVIDGKKYECRLVKP